MSQVFLALVFVLQCFEAADHRTPGVSPTTQLVLAPKNLFGVAIRGVVSGMIHHALIVPALRWIDLQNWRRLHVPVQLAEGLLFLSFLKLCRKKRELRIGLRQCAFVVEQRFFVAPLGHL